MDIDLLGRGGKDEDVVLSQIRDMLTTEVEPDGLVFQVESLRAEKIKEDADYEGIRIRFLGMLDTARINMQIDIGYGDAVYPAPKETEFPAMLAFPAPILLCYNLETVIAEKVEAMVKLGELNSRMKDFYDIWLLSRKTTLMDRRFRKQC
jgi:predicted nucleotidyltransferase component of viral defense system